MIIAIDVGNTRTKWGLRQSGTWLQSGACSTSDADALRTALAALPALKSARRLSFCRKSVGASIDRIWGLWFISVYSSWVRWFVDWTGTCV